MCAYDCVCDSATANASFVPAWAGFGSRVNPGFRARVCEVFGGYFGVSPEVVGRAMDDYMGCSAEDGERPERALGDFLVQLVELDV